MLDRIEMVRAGKRRSKEILMALLRIKERVRSSAHGMAILDKPL